MKLHAASQVSECVDVGVTFLRALISKDLRVPEFPQLFVSSSYNELIAAVVVVAAAILLGMLAASLTRRYLVPRFPTLEPGGFVARAAKLARAGVAAIVIAGFAGVRGDDAGAALLMAAALGFAVAVAAYQIARALELRPTPAVILSVGVFVLVLAGGLGGLRPLAAGLDSDILAEQRHLSAGRLEREQQQLEQRGLSLSPEGPVRK